MIRTLAHVSDLHMGRDDRTSEATRRIVAALVEADVDAVLVTGDLTHRGRAAELREFEDAFEPLLATGRVVVVPGNHDRLGEDAGAGLMIGARVGVADLAGVHVVRVDSTAPHNRSMIAAHGLLSEGDLAAVDDALGEAPRGALSVVMLHHHVLPLPPDDLAERLSSWLGWPNAAELSAGTDLLARASGRCDLVLHGHRHVPSIARPLAAGGRPLTVVNAGSSPGLGGARVFAHEDGVVRRMGWLAAATLEPARAPRERAA